MFVRRFDEMQERTAAEEIAAIAETAAEEIADVVDNRTIAERMGVMTGPEMLQYASRAVSSLEDAFIEMAVAFEAARQVLEQLSEYPVPVALAEEGEGEELEEDNEEL